MSVINEFLRVAKGQTVWLDIAGRASFYQGKVERFDREHIIISSELGFDCIAISDIRGISLPKQVEIVAE